MIEDAVLSKPRHDCGGLISRHGSLAIVGVLQLTEMIHVTPEPRTQTRGTRRSFALVLGLRGMMNPLMLVSIYGVLRDLIGTSVT